MMKSAVLGNRFVLSALSLLLLMLLVTRGDSFTTKVAHAAAPSITSTEVNQTPAGSDVTVVTLPTHIVYTATVSISTGQAQALTIQLKGDQNIGTRTLNCSSAANAGPAVAKLNGNPSCRWPGPVNAGTFTFIFAGNLSGSIGDAVPDAASLVCSDSNNNGSCSDEPAESTVGLSDADGDVGALTIAGSGAAPNVTTEVSQFPVGGRAAGCSGRGAGWLGSALRGAVCPQCHTGYGKRRGGIGIDREQAWLPWKHHKKNRSRHG